MDTKKTGGPAFPQNVVFDPEKGMLHDGMSLRDYFAAKAMAQGMAVLVASGNNLNEYQLNTLAKTAYLAADAMLTAREAS